ncbi:MAG: SAM-dependent methyltransferase [Desulfobacteraceae bacterium]|nr:SAM-dependent methyltransferase [Desulfobacteraceae bacterium]
MKPHKASRTAMHMALFRALESARGARRRIIFDPLAKHYLNAPLRLVAGLSQIPLAHTVISRFIDRHWPGARTSGIARTRAIDDGLYTALADGTRQVVILGAGYDSRAYRILGLAHTTVFEVDYPATSTKKLRRTQRAVGEIPANICFVQIDFNRQSLETVLKEAGYNPDLKTAFIWEGVTSYLTPEAVDATLVFCARAAAGSRIIFTYIDQNAVTSPQTFHGAARIARFLKNVGEQWTFGLDPAQLASHLTRLGLELESDLTANQYRQQYFTDQSHTMHGFEFSHIAVARVPAQAHEQST